MTRLEYNYLRARRKERVAKIAIAKIAIAKSVNGASQTSANGALFGKRCSRFLRRALDALCDRVVCDAPFATALFAIAPFKPLTFTS